MRDLLLSFLAAVLAVSVVVWLVYVALPIFVILR